MRSSSESSKGGCGNRKRKCVVVDGFGGVEFGKIGLKRRGDDIRCEEVSGRELVDSVGQGVDGK